MIWKIRKALVTPWSSIMFLINKIKNQQIHLVDSEIKIPFDGQLYIGNPIMSGIARSILKTGYWEYLTTQKFKQIIKKDDCVVDVGAAGGYFTLVAAKRAAKVIAFEPIPDLNLLVKRNVKINRYENCTVSDFALLDENCVKLMEKPGAKSRISLTKTVEPSCEENLQVECRRFDEVILSLHGSEVNVVKIDIEGAEYPALLGMYDTLVRDHPKLLIELHPSLFPEFGYKIEQIFDLLESLEYAIFPVDSSHSKLDLIKSGKILDNIVIYCS